MKLNPWEGLPILLSMRQNMSYCYNILQCFLPGGLHMQHQLVHKDKHVIISALHVLYSYYVWKDDIRLSILD